MRYQRISTSRRSLTLSILWLCFFLVIQCQSSLIDELNELENAQFEESMVYDPDDNNPLRHLQEEYTGKLYSSCNRRNPCLNGLDCVRAPTGRLCYPMACLRDAAEYTFVEQRLDTFADTILTRVGLKDNLVNQTTLAALEDNSMTEDEAVDYLVNGGVTQRIHRALQEDPTIVNAFRNNAQACFPQRDSTKYAIDSEDSPEQGDIKSYYMGLHIEIAAGLKFVYQAGGAALPNGTIPANACYAHLCLGLGMDLDAHAGTVLGVITTGDPGDIKYGSWMFDADIAAGLHFGGAFGWTVPRGILKAEYTGGFGPNTGIAFGLGGGAGASACTASIVAN